MPINSPAQQCTSGNPPTTATLQCGMSCTSLSFTVPDIRETSDYKAIDLAYTPYPFESRTVPPVAFASPPVWPGNSYSGVQSLPFTFCFFDSLYDYMVIGANGCVSFDTSNALKWCEPRLYVNSSIRRLPTAFYARALIAGVMQDLDPFDTIRVVTGEKVEYRIEGVAPCRRAVISYFKVPLWPAAGNCQTSVNTYQIVLHEGTGIIDVYQKDKPPCTGSNNGIAILGIQNWERDKEVSPRNRNGYNWGGTNINEAYRFLPSGGNSRFLQAQLWEGVRIIATTTTTTPLADGLMNIEFPSVCPAATSNYLVLKTIYSSCTGTGQVELFDTVFINRITNLNATWEQVPASCGGSNGSIIVHVAPGEGVPPYTYTINGGPEQTDSVFSGLAAGTYTIIVKDNSGCSKTMTVDLRSTTLLVTTMIVDTPSCSAAVDGVITVNVLNGNPPFSYTINGGPPQVSNIFSGLAPGSYDIQTFDSRNCLSAIVNVVIPAGPPLAVTIQTTNTACSGANNGTITITPTNGTGPYQYSLNSGPVQSSNVFNNLSAGNYSIKIIDASGCTANVSAQVATGQPLNASAVKTDASCNGGNDATITVTVNNGVAPYQYSIDNINFQSANIFNGLTAGNYTIYIKDNNACSGSVPITVSQPTAIAAALTVQSTTCNGDSDGSITINASGGTSPYQYSLNGSIYQSANNFNNLLANNYTVYVKDSKGCIYNQTAVVTQPQPLQFTTTTQNASCGGGNDGKIIVTATGGNNNNYQYSADGINFLPLNIINVAPGTYTVTVIDVKGCTVSQAGIVVGLSNTLAIATIKDTSICRNQSVSLNTISIATQYNWTPSTGLNNAAIQNPVANPTVTTTYIVQAILGGCNGSDTVVVTVLDLPVANAGTGGNICKGDSLQLNASGSENYSWSPATSLTNPLIPNPFAKPQQTTAYNLIVTDVNGCRSSAPATVTVTVIQPVQVNITPDTYVSPGDVIQLHAEGGISYLWSPSTGLNNTMIPDPTATITNDITYNVKVTSVDGCVAEDSVTIKAYKGPDIYVPTAFTPNRDGRNDKFTPFPVGIKQLEYFRVYNRWGQLIFNTNKLHEGWDGKVNGIDQDNAVYVWVVRCITNEGRVIFKKGIVSLIR